MTKNEDAALTNIPVPARDSDIAAILHAQFSHLDNGEVRALLEQLHSPVWTNEELLEVFAVSHFEPPYVHVICQKTGRRGTVMYVDTPRFYFAFVEDEKDDQ